LRVPSPSYLYISSFFCSLCPPLHVLHSFPTRRSSDLPRSHTHSESAVSRRRVRDNRGRKRSPYARQSRRVRPRSGLCEASGSGEDRKSTRLNSSHGSISYAVFCLTKKQ